MYNKKFMDLAYKESLKAFDNDEVPVGAVIVKDNKVIAKAYNKKETNKCSLEHAEIRVIQKASKILNNWRLSGCDIYVTLEPCPMCASAIHQARISNIYYCIKQKDTLNERIVKDILSDRTANSPVDIYFVEYDDAAKNILQDFFKKRR